VKNFKRIKETAKAGAIALASAVLVAAVAAACTSIATVHPATRISQFPTQSVVPQRGKRRHSCTPGSGLSLVHRAQSAQCSNYGANAQYLVCHSPAGVRQRISTLPRRRSRAPWLYQPRARTPCQFQFLSSKPIRTKILANTRFSSLLSKEQRPSVSLSQLKFS